MCQNQFFTAIDLGTTNSVIAHANFAGGRLVPCVIEIPRRSGESITRSKLLPSVVFYSKNKSGDMTADVGDYAKSRYGTRNGYVCKSVKSLMGRSETVSLAEEIEDKTPADVSAQILKFLVAGAKKALHQQYLSDVVITVPASFDSDQCQATIDAARKAGINTDNFHDILLYEPKAVIYDFMRMQEAGEVPSNLLNLDTPKNVLVFDLGGGTLDVTLHKAERTSNGLYNITDIAISRYTSIGGDNFDELLAADMLKKFEDYAEIQVSGSRREEVLCKLRKQAENMKLELSMEYDSASQFDDSDLADDTEFEVMIAGLYDSYSFEATYTKAEIEQILSPLMGYDYKEEDFKRIQYMGEKDINNIIYPILDVLDKAGEKVKIDAVLMNGGMTKFYMISQRLKDFFGFEPLAVNDPDLAVARGGVYYHYCLHKYNVQRSDFWTDAREGIVSTSDDLASRFITNTILNDTINVGLRNEYVELLIPAGTLLPYRSEEIRDRFCLERDTDTIGVELFLGRGKSKNLPNRRIATRTIQFQRTYPANTPISFQIYINGLRMMVLEAWITDRPNTKTISELDIASLKGGEKTSGGIKLTRKMKLNAKSEINDLKTLAERNRSSSDHDLNSAISAKLQSIAQASNPEDFFEPCSRLADGLSQSNVMLGYIYVITLAFKDRWTGSQNRKFLNLAKRHFDKYASGVPQNSYVLRNALELIAAADPNFMDFYTEYLMRVPTTSDRLRQSMIQFVIRYGSDTGKAAAFLENFLTASNLDTWITNLLIEHFGRGTSKENQKVFAKLTKNLAKALDNPDTDAIPPYLVVLIAEFFSNDVPNSLHDDSYTAKKVWQSVKRYLTKADETFAAAVTAIWEGEELTEEQEAARKEAFQG